MHPACLETVLDLLDGRYSVPIIRKSLWLQKKILVLVSIGAYNDPVYRLRVETSQRYYILRDHRCADNRAFN